VHVNQVRLQALQLSAHGAVYARVKDLRERVL
jgi:hypothetical protein